MYTKLQTEAKTERRSTQGQLEVILDAHYATLASLVKKPAPQYEPVDKETQTKVIAELAKQQNNPRFSGAIQLCKIHGTPLTPQGKCLQKGCKYA